MAKLNEQFRRMQKLAGIITEEQNNIPEDIEEYLQMMISDFSDGNDNEYPAGKKMIPICVEGLLIARLPIRLINTPTKY